MTVFYLIAAAKYAQLKMKTKIFSINVFLIAFFLIHTISIVQASTTTVCTAGTCTVTFTTSNLSWPVPAGVTSITGLVVGGGGGGYKSTSAGGGGTGGALRYSSAITVVSGDSLIIIVGTGGAAGAAGKAGGFSSIANSSTTFLLAAGGGAGSLSAPGANNGTSTTTGGVITGGNGGIGGDGAGSTSAGGGGGAGGYSDNGGDGGDCGGANAGAAGAGGGGGGGGAGGSGSTGGGGGGVGITGAGANGGGGASGSPASPGNGGSGGNAGSGSAGGLYGGGGGGDDTGTTAGAGNNGAAVITYLEPDLIYPTFNAFNSVPANNTAYSPGATYMFNSTITSTNATAGMEFNSVNYTAANSSNNFTASVTNLAAGVYSYYWWARGNGTQKNPNITSIMSYTVAQATPVLTFLANSGTSNLSLIYPWQVNISASASAGTVGLDKDNVDYSTNNGLNVSLPAGSYIFRANITGNQNYSDVGYSYYNVTINKTIPQGSLTNTTAWTVNYPTSATIGLTESNAGDGDLTYIVYRDGISKGTGETVTLGAGTYNYVLNTTGGENYTINASMDAQTLTVNQISSSINLTLNNIQGNATITQGSLIDLNCSTIAGDTSAYLLLYREGNLINNKTSPVGNKTTFNTVQIENITCVYLNSQNYTASSETWWVNVSIKTPSINFTYPTPANGTTSTTSFFIINASITNPAVTGVKFNWNGTNYTIFNSSVIAKYNFGNLSGLKENDSFVADLTGLHNGTVTNAVWISTGKSDGAYSFDGNGDYINLSSDIGISNNSGSVTVWFKKADVSSATTKYIFGHRYNTTTNDRIYIYVGGTNDGTRAQHMTCGFGDDVTPLETTSIQEVNDSQWHFATIVWNSNGMGCYLDSSLIGVYAYSIPALDGLVTVGIAPSLTANLAFNGTIDELTIWNYTLSSAEINQLYFSFLSKYNSTDWNLYINQSKNSTIGLDAGAYSYFASASNSNVENLTETRYYTVSSNTCSCPGAGNNWEINMGDSCNIADNCNLGTGNITFIGTGTTIFNSTINCKNLEYPITNQNLNIGSNALVIVG